MERKKKNIIELTNCSVSQYHEKEKLPFIVLTDDVRSMHNIGAIFRTADAFLVKELVLGGISGTPPHPEISKTALGADESVAWRHVNDAYSEVLLMKESGWKVCVLEQTHNSIPLNEFKVNKEDKILLVVGNEVKGVDQRIVDVCDYVIEIPQCGVKHSLNVSVSAGIAMWQIVKEYKPLNLISR